MRLWRISRYKHALDRQCAGSALYGGRWNPIGMPALYGATSISLCSLEKFVHAGAGPFPPLALVAIDLPDDSPLYVPEIAALPHGWDAMPTSGPAQVFGGAWLARGAELAMKVPSAIVPEEANVVVNPRHPGYARILLSIVRPFAFDRRMFK
ncbi:RES family NAD+ phosphorylase [Pseudoduganella namucuonensis]|uniref:RES domain-containing protein n=1 Tax=Pseudoduganella namucuonensis TaxID=1035707 RepID=A0A1I7HMM5_9BURK|nr:RES family NAD+ phosphorylase [Pseudoduganella namucuonensis]SFU61975.1 RES domain-containing protein [Pseudoduganella namucuonensis]